MKTIFIIAALLISAHALAQVFPVQVTPQLLPPYSPYLSDYTTPASQKLIVHLRANDLTLSNYLCRLKVTIEGASITITTKKDFMPAPVTLDGSVATTLYGDDLREYFDPDALEFAGYTRSEYERSGRLPEGMYRFIIEVLDYNRGTVVSNKGMATAWITLNDPPLLNLPANNSQLTLQDPPNILFSWTPRHTGSVNAAFSVEYIFRLVEIWPDNRNAYDALLTQPPLYEIATSENRVMYGPSEPALIPGRSYAWQVEARDTQGKDLFKNGGRSEAFRFKYGEELGVPANLGLEKAKVTSLTVRWDAVTSKEGKVKYRIQYRPRRRVPEHQWYEAVTAETRRTISNLRENTDYELRVRAEVTLQDGAYTPEQTFTTLAEPTAKFVCRDNVKPPPRPANSLPVFPLSVNDTIHAGGFDVLVRDVMKRSGQYYGAGVAIVPWLNGARVRVTFEKIEVNDRFWLTSGSINTVWQPESRFLLEEETPLTPENAPQSGALDITVVAADTVIEVEGAAIATVTKDEEGNTVVITTDGQEQVLKQGGSYAVVDEAGNGYVIDERGNVAKTTATEARAAAARGGRNYDIVFRFEKGDARFGFDENRFAALSHFYQQLDNGGYVAWKALSASEPEVIAGRLQSGAIGINDLRFQAGGSPLKPVSSDKGNVVLSVQGKGAGMEEELVVFQQAADSLPVTTVGKLNLVTYDPILYNLVIVPVNGASMPGGLDAATVSRSLNAIYSQAVVQWRVSEAPELRVDLPQSFDDGDAGMLSNYTGDMKKVLRAYGPLQQTSYYLFLIDEPRNMATLGYMPRNKRAGFVFVTPHAGNSDEFLKTVAHELGHGAFNLKHTFSEHALPAGTTDNIMDYSQGTALYKYQWDYIHEPRVVLDLFGGEEGSTREALSEQQLLEWWEKLPPYKKAAEILAEHLEDTDIYKNVTSTCDDEQCVIRAELTIGTDITYTMEVTLVSAMTPDELIEMLMYEYRVDLWEAFNVKAEDQWDELYHWWRKQNDDLAQQKGWQVSALNFLADVITGATLVPAVEGWITGKHWRDGHELAGWEQALAALDFLAAEELAKGCITNLIVKVGSKSLSLLKIPEGTRTLISNAIQNGYRITVISQTDFILKNLEGTELARIIGNNFYLLHNGRQIILNLTKRTTLLGRYFEGTRNFLSAKLQNSNVINMLDVKDWSKPTSPSASVLVSEASQHAEEFWEVFNKPFVNNALDNGDDIVLLTDPKDLMNIFYTDSYRRIVDVNGKAIDVALTGDVTSDIRALLARNAFPTMYGREVIYLSEKLGMPVEELSLMFYK